MNLLRRMLTQYRYGAIALVTVLTLGIVGAVVLGTTSAGCGPANKIGLKTARCLSAVAPPTLGTALPTVPLASPPESTIPPYNPGVSAYPPYNRGASPMAPPFAPPGSGMYPPLPYATSSNAGPSSVGLNCRLPVFAGGPGSGGFIVFPGETFVADPRSAVIAPSPSPGTPTPPPPQYGPGYPAGFYGLSYDAGYGKWLPVPNDWVSPDGIHYVYPLGGEIYVQNVATGSQLELAQGQGYRPLEVENDGVYVILPGQAGLWFLPYSGTPRQVTATGFWQGLARGVAYGTATSAVPAGVSNTIQKLNIKSGAINESFFSQAGGQSTVIGFDLVGDPVIQTYYQQSSYTNPGGNAIFIVTGPNTAYAIAAVAYYPYANPYAPAYPSGRPIADMHGLWFSTGSGIVLLANNQWYWVASIGGQLAGPCV